MMFIPFSEFRRAGRMISHEEAWARGQLVVVWRFDELLPFLQGHATLFVSHQWLGPTTPDKDNVHFAAIVSAVESLCARLRLPEADLFLWLDCALARA